VEQAGKPVCKRIIDNGAAHQIDPVWGLYRNRADG